MRKCTLFVAINLIFMHVYSIDFFSRCCRKRRSKEIEIPRPGNHTYQPDRTNDYLKRYNVLYPRHHKPIAPKIKHTRKNKVSDVKACFITPSCNIIESNYVAECLDSLFYKKMSASFKKALMQYTFTHGSKIYLILPFNHCDVPVSCDHIGSSEYKFSSSHENDRRLRGLPYLTKNNTNESKENLEATKKYEKLTESQKTFIYRFLLKWKNNKAYSLHRAVLVVHDVKTLNSYVDLFKSATPHISHAYEAYLTHEKLTQEDELSIFLANTADTLIYRNLGGLLYRTRYRTGGNVPYLNYALSPEDKEQFPYKEVEALNMLLSTVNDLRSAKNKSMLL